MISLPWASWQIPRNWEPRPRPCPPRWSNRPPPPLTACLLQFNCSTFSFIKGLNCMWSTSFISVMKILPPPHHHHHHHHHMPCFNLKLWWTLYPYPGQVQTGTGQNQYFGKNSLFFCEKLAICKSSGGNLVSKAFLGEPPLQQQTISLVQSKYVIFLFHFTLTLPLHYQCLFYWNCAMQDMQDEWSIVGDKRFI